MTPEVNFTKRKNEVKALIEKVVLSNLGEW